MLFGAKNLQKAYKFQENAIISNHRFWFKITLFS